MTIIRRAAVISGAIALVLGAGGCGTVSDVGLTTVTEVIEGSPYTTTVKEVTTETSHVEEGHEDYGVGLDPTGRCLRNSAASAVFFEDYIGYCWFFVTAADQLEPPRIR